MSIVSGSPDAGSKCVKYAEVHTIAW